MLLSAFLNRLAIAAQMLESNDDKSFAPEVLHILEQIEEIAKLPNAERSIRGVPPNNINESISGPIPFIYSDIVDDNYYNILEALADGVIVANLEGRIVYATKITIKLFSIESKEVLIGSQITDWILPSYRPIALANFRDAVINGQSSAAKLYPIQNRRGDIFWTEINSSIILNSQSKTTHIVSVLRDVTDRENQKIELNQSRLNIKAIIENIDDMLWSVDINYKLLFFNSAVYDYFNSKFNIQLAIGDSAVKPFMEALLKNSKEVYYKCLTGDSHHEKQEFYINGAECFREISAAPIKSPSGAITAVAIIARDITDRVNSENTIIKTSANIASLLDNTTDAIWLVDTNYRINVSNVAAKEYFNKNFGINLDEYNLFTGFLSESVKGAWIDALNRSFDGDSFIYQTSAKSGSSTIYFEHRLHPIIDFEGNVSGTTIFTRNISEKILWEKEITLNEERLQSLNKLNSLIRNDSLELLADAVAEAAKLSDSYAGFITLIENEEFTNTYICTSSSIIPISKLKRVENLNVEVKTILEKSLAEGAPIVENNFSEKKKVFINRLQISRILAVPVIIENTKTAIISVINKASEYDAIDNRQLFLFAYEIWKFFQTKRIEDKLALERKQLISIFDSIPENIYVSDIQTKTILYANKHIQDTYGAELIGRKCFKAFYNLESPCDDCACENINATSGISRQEYYNATLNKHFITINKIIKWPDGRDVKFELSIDVTRETNITKAIEESELKLKELNATKDKFFSIIAHDLKNPFSAILNYSMELIEKHDILNEKTKIEFVSEIHDSAKAIYKLLENLLIWARTQTGKIKFAPEYIDLSETAFDAVYVYKSAAEEKNISVVNNIQTNTIVFADYNMLETVFRNLVSNAIKFTPANGAITLDYSLVEYAGSANSQIIISDTGVGIAPSDIECLFNIGSSPLYSQSKEKGAGLGLIICKEFVERHGGKIFAKSIPESGAKFIFTLPIVEEND